MARRQSSALRRLRSAWLLPLVITLICVVLVPRLVDGYASLQWTRYHAPRGAAGRRGLEHARQAVRSATRTLDLMAPLPWAREASELGLQASRRVERDGDRAAALELYAELRASLEQARSSPLRGLGLGGVAGEARSLEAAAATAPPGATK